MKINTKIDRSSKQDEQEKQHSKVLDRVSILLFLFFLRKRVVNKIRKRNKKIQCETFKTKEIKVNCCERYTVYKMANNNSVFLHDL